MRVREIDAAEVVALVLERAADVSLPVRRAAVDWAKAYA